MNIQNSFGKLITIFGISLVCLIAGATFIIDKLMKNKQSEIVINKIPLEHKIDILKDNNIPAPPNSIASQIVPQEAAINNLSNNFAENNVVNNKDNSTTNPNLNVSASASASIPIASKLILKDKNQTMINSQNPEQNSNIISTDLSNLNNNVNTQNPYYMNNYYSQQALQIQAMQQKIAQLEKSIQYNNTKNKFTSKTNSSINNKKLIAAKSNNIKHNNTDTKLSSQKTLAVVEDRAWLQDKQGNEYNVIKGEKLENGTEVKLIDDENKVVIHTAN